MKFLSTSFRHLSLFVFAVLLVAQGAHCTPTQNSHSVKVGVIAPLSGEFAKWGLDVQAAIEMFKKKEPRKVSFLFEDDQSCQQRAGLSAYRKLRSNNIDVLITFCTAVAKTLFIIYSADALASFLKQADAQKLWEQKTLLGSYTFVFFFEELKKLYPALTRFEGLLSANLKQEVNPQFTKEFEAMYQRSPQQFADYAYDVASIIQECGTDESCYGKERSGASGPIRFNRNRYRIGEFELLELKNGKFVPLRKSSLKTEL